MSKRILAIRKSVLPKLLLLILSIVIISVGTFSSIPTHADSTTTVYLDQPTINGTAIGETFTINLNISNAQNITTWQAGMLFNATLLNCTCFEEGTFLKNVGKTYWQEATIDNTLGVISIHGCAFEGDYKASGDGQLAYLNFTVKALGVSDLHLRDVKVIDYDHFLVPINIIDVYTVVCDTTHYTVVTVSNSTGKTGAYHSGFYDHAFSVALEELSFKVTGPYLGFSNVTIPKTLFWIDHVVIDDIQLETEEMKKSENSTHTSVYFTYPAGIHKIQITSRMSSNISLALSSDSIVLGSSVTLSGNITAEDSTARPNATVTILYRPVGAPDWYTAGQNLTDSNSNYTYTWTPETGGTHEVKTMWEGDEETVGDESDALLLIVLYVFEPVPGKYVVIETNSTVAEFNSIPTLNFSEPLKQINFNVTGQKDTKGYSNVTIPETLLPPPKPEIMWKVIINNTLLSAEEIFVTGNSTHTSVYFTYTTSTNIVQITTRMSSNISLALSSDSIDLGSSVTLSGNITAEDSTARPNATLTIQSKLSGENWTTLTVETDENGSYTYDWMPETVGTYEVMASWEGDNETIGDESDVLTLTVIENSTISIALSSTNITFGSSVTISGSIDPLKPDVAVTIQYKLIDEAYWHVAGENRTDQDSSYTFTWTPDTPGTYNVKATWMGDEITHNATSNVLTLTAKWNSTILIALSSTEITQGKSVTISGNITAADNIARVNVTVKIQSKLSGENWTTLTVETDENGTYSYDWTPEAAGIYDVKTRWEGDETTFDNESDVRTLTVKEAPAGIPLEILAATVVAIIIIAAIVVYFVKFRKPE